MKQSLFKQKIKSIKQQDNKHGFPTIPKIQITGLQSQHTPTLIEQISSTISKNQFQEIQQRNDEILKNMPKEEIINHQKTILSQIPSSFLKKLNQNNPSNHQSKQQAPQPQQIPQPPQQQQQNHNKIGQQAKQQIGIDFLQQILVVITSGQLHMINKNFTHNQSIKQQSIIHLTQVKMMICSQNNQTQIIGSQILSKVLINLPKQKVITMNNHKLHRGILLTSICNSFLPSLFHQVIRNKFTTCWIEFMKDICKTIKVVLEDLPHRFQVEYLQLLQNQLKKKIQNIQPIKQQIKQCICKIQLSLENRKQKQLQEIPLNIQNNKIDEIVQLLVLEQSQSKLHDFQTILSKLDHTLSHHISNKLGSLKIVFQIIEKIHLYFSYSDVKQMKTILGKLSKITNKYLKDDIFLTAQMVNYHIMYFICIKMTNEEHFQTIMDQFNNYANHTQQQVGMMVYLNIQNYSNGKISQQETNNLNVMGRYLKNIIPINLLSIENIFYNILFIFQNDSSPYNSLEGIDKLIQTIIQKCRIDNIKKVISIDRVKILVEKYNFSSFGNPTFTKLLFYLCVINEQYEAIIIEEVIARYPFLFYFVVEDYGVFGSQLLYKQNNRLSNEKKEIKEMLLQDPIYQKQNIFFQYLI